MNEEIQEQINSLAECISWLGEDPSDEERRKENRDAAHNVLVHLTRLILLMVKASKEGVSP